MLTELGYKRLTYNEILDGKIKEQKSFLVKTLEPTKQHCWENLSESTLTIRL